MRVKCSPSTPLQLWLAKIGPSEHNVTLDFGNMYKWYTQLDVAWHSVKLL